MYALAAARVFLGVCCVRVCPVCFSVLFGVLLTINVVYSRISPPYRFIVICPLAIAFGGYYVRCFCVSHAMFYSLILSFAVVVCASDLLCSLRDICFYCLGGARRSSWPITSIGICTWKRATRRRTSARWRNSTRRWRVASTAMRKRYGEAVRDHTTLCVVPCVFTRLRLYGVRLLFFERACLFSCVCPRL